MFGRTFARTFLNSSRARFATATFGTVGFATSASLLMSKDVQAASGSVDYAQVRKDIADILDQDSWDDGSLGPVFIRLGWHASGTYNKEDGSGGSDGATMRFSPEADHGANAGLHHARNFLEVVKKKHPEISYSDLWTLASVVAIEEMGGPAIPWRSGRADKASGEDCTPDGRLPDAALGPQHLRDIFYRMGFNDQEIVALSGAHTFGRCHTDRSGFWGPWTRAPTTFSNLYFQELLNNTWTVKQWNGPKQYEDPTGDLMMLPTDMCLIEDAEFKKWVEVYANDEARFTADFTNAFKKLTELGVPAFQSQFPMVPVLAGAGVLAGLVAIKSMSS